MASVTTEPMEFSRSAVRRGWAVHVFTTSGVVVGMLALQAVFDRKAADAIWFLLLTQVIDGIDGPIARQVDVRTRVPKIDGYVLDLVIDYVTCVVVPAMFLHRFELLPGSVSLWLAGAIVFFSAIWFSRTDMMTEDLWFNGFPAVWNLVAPTLMLAHLNPWANAVIVVVFCGLMLTDVQFPHSVRSTHWRIPTLAMTIGWLLALLWGTGRLPDYSLVARLLLAVCVGYFVVLCTRRTLAVRGLHGARISA